MDAAPQSGEFVRCEGRHFFLLLGLLSCSKDEPVGPGNPGNPGGSSPVGSVTLSRDTMRGEVGDTFGLRVDVRDQQGAPSSTVASWSSLTPAVAELLTTGYTTRFAARAAGNSRAIATADIKSDTAVLIVLSPFTATTLSADADTMDAIGVADSATVISLFTMRLSGTSNATVRFANLRYVEPRVIQLLP